jgi:hypothetical protein
MVRAMTLLDRTAPRRTSHRGRRAIRDDRTGKAISQTVHGLTRRNQ